MAAILLGSALSAYSFNTRRCNWWIVYVVTPVKANQVSIPVGAIDGEHLHLKEPFRLIVSIPVGAIDGKLYLFPK